MKTFLLFGFILLFSSTVIFCQVDTLAHKDTSQLGQAVKKSLEKLIISHSKPVPEPFINVGLGFSVNLGKVKLTNPLFVRPFDSKRTNYSLDFRGGIDVSYYLNKRFLISQGAYYTHYNYTIESYLIFDYLKSIYKESISAINLPLYVRYNLSEKLNIYASAGLSFEFYFASYAKLAYAMSDAPDSQERSEKRFEIATKNMNFIPFFALGYSIVGEKNILDIELRYCFLPQQRVEENMFGDNFIEAFTKYDINGYSYNYNSLSVLLRINHKIIKK